MPFGICFYNDPIHIDRAQKRRRGEFRHAKTLFPFPLVTSLIVDFVVVTLLATAILVGGRTRLVEITPEAVVRRSRVGPGRHISVTSGGHVRWRTATRPVQSFRVPEAFSEPPVRVPSGWNTNGLLRSSVWIGSYTDENQSLTTCMLQ